MTTKKASAGIAAGTAAAIALAVPAIQRFEGVWLTAQIDTIGTGQPPTVCYGATKAEIPNLKPGQKFTLEQCRNLLEKSLPKYTQAIAPCIHVPISPLTRAALISMSYNAGPGAVCKSNVVARMNAGDMHGACETIKGWYIRARGVVVRGLINRRADESRMCAQGLLPAPKPRFVPWWQAMAETILFWKDVK